MYANKIIVTKHAIDRFTDRVDKSLSIDEVEDTLIDIFKNGKPKKLRKCIFENNATEFQVRKDDVSIMAIIRSRKNEYGNKYKEGIIITCLGDNLRLNWYKDQYKKDRKRAWR